MTLTCAAAETAKAVSAERTVTLVQALTAMPQGVEAMDTDFPGLVQTSLNMGVVKLEATDCTSRSPSGRPSRPGS